MSGAKLMKVVEISRVPSRILVAALLPSLRQP
jgi:hypothetical protein